VSAAVQAGGQTAPTARRGTQPSVLDVRLVPAALASWVAAWWVTGHPGSAAQWLRLAAAASVAAIFVLTAFGGPADLAPTRTGWRSALAHFALMGAAIAVVSLGATAQFNKAASLVGLADSGHRAVLVGRVASEPRTASFGGYQWDLRVHQVSAGQVTYATGSAVRVNSPTAPEYGAEVSVEARLRPARSGESANARASVQEFDVQRPPNPVVRWANRRRAAMLTATRSLPPETAGLVAGMAIGDTTQLPDDLAAAFKTTGLTHLTAVSGGHFSIVLTLVATFAAATRAPKWLRVLAVGLGAGVFVLLVRPEASVVRAAAMCAVTMLGLALGRRSATLPSLATCCIVLLAADAWLARSFGFALSCAATGSLAILTGPLTARLRPWLGRPLAFAVAVPLAAQLSCAPILALFTPGIPTTAVLANVLAAPAVTPATVLGLTAALAPPSSSSLAPLLARIAALPTTWIAGVAKHCAQLPLAKVTLPWAPEAGIAAALTTAAISGGLLWLLLRRPPAEGWPRAWTDRAQQVAKSTRHGCGATRRRLVAGVPSQRDRRWLRGCVLLLLAALLVGSFQITRRRLAVGPVPPDWRAAACDVGQGDAFAIRTGTNAAMLIDVGPDPGKIDHCLTELSVDRIDLLVLTHDHADHVGGLSGAVAGRNVQSVLAPFDPHLSAPRLSVVADEPTAGQLGRDGWSATWVLLNPAAQFGDDLNNDSYALAVASGGPGGDFQIVDLADLEEAGQQELLARLRSGLDPTGDLTGDVDLLKLAHHGSASQSLGLARWLSPAFAVASSGVGNSFGHPTQTALDLYRSVGAQLVRTDECGTVIFAAHGGALVPSCVG